MKLLLDPKVLLLLVIPFMFGFAPLHDDGKGIGNAAPPGIGGNGPWDSQNMDLLAHMPLDQIGGGLANVLGSDCWGWTDPQDGTEYAICGLSNATSFIDISDPVNPKYLGKLPTQTGNAAWRDMKVYNNHVFVVADGNDNHGMQVFDLTQLRTADRSNPTTFTNTAWYSGVTSVHNIAINEDSGFAYLVGSNRASGGLHVVNINNPANPVQAGNFSADGYTHDAQIVNYVGPDPDYSGREIAFASNEDTVTIVDVTNKSSMTMISRNAYAEDGYTHQGWLSEDQRYFYMGDELDESQQGGPTRTHVFDCLDLDNPVYLGYHSGSMTSIDHNLYIKGNMIYQANYSTGLRVLQIGATALDLTEVAYFDTYNTDNDTDFDGAWSCFPFFDSGVVLVNDRQNGMFLVRLTPVEFDFPTGRKDYINPQGGVEFTVQTVDVFDNAQGGTGVLHVMRGQGIESFPMSQQSANVYEANFPPTECGTELRYFFSVETTSGEIIYNPTNAPLGAYLAVTADDVTVPFDDDFESDLGWSVSGNATDGQWERGVPAGDGNRGDPLTDADGSGSCYLTDNVAGNSDVDGGSTVLTSPLMNATGANVFNTRISYHTWFSNNAGSSPQEDIMLVEISNDNGDSWTTLETIGPTGEEISGGWFYKSFDIADFVTPTDEMLIRFTASDLGDGSVVEAGVDGVRIQLAHCDVEMTVVPEGLKLPDGIQVGGQLSDLFDGDDQYLELDPSPTSNPIKQKVNLILQSTSPTESPNTFGFVLESAMMGGPSGDVILTVELLNYDTNKFELLDIRAAANSDEVVEITIKGDASRFVQPGTRELTANINWKSESFAGATFNWSIDVDQAVWLID